MHTAELYSWEFYDHPLGRRIRGIIKNDSARRFNDGTRIFSSLIKRATGLMCVTLNTEYRLKGDWEGPWRMRTLNDAVIDVIGPVHFDTIRG